MKTGKTVSRFMKALDLKRKPALTLTITSAEPVEFKDRNPTAIFFKEIEQGMVLAKTVERFLHEAFDPDYNHETGEGETDTWIGKTVVVYYDANVTYEGKRCGGLRIRKP